MALFLIPVCPSNSVEFEEELKRTKKRFKIVEIAVAISTCRGTKAV